VGDRLIELLGLCGIHVVDRIRHALGAAVVVLLREVIGVVVGAGRGEHSGHRQQRDDAGDPPRDLRAHVFSCSAETSSGPRPSASMPETAASALATVVITGTPRATARSRIAFSSYSDTRPRGVFRTS